MAAPSSVSTESKPHPLFKAGDKAVRSYEIPEPEKDVERIDFVARDVVLELNGEHGLEKFEEAWLAKCDHPVGSKDHKLILIAEANWDEHSNEYEDVVGTRDAGEEKGVIRHGLGWKALESLLLFYSQEHDQARKGLMQA